MLYPRNRHPDLVKVFGTGLVSKSYTCPTFTKLAWIMVHLDLLMNLSDLDAESGS